MTNGELQKSLKQYADDREIRVTEEGVTSRALLGVVEKVNEPGEPIFIVGDGVIKGAA